MIANIHATNRFLSRLFLVLMLMGAVALPEAPAHAADSAEILQAVKERARQDAESGAAMRAQDVAKTFRHNNAGLSTTLISIIYTREYNRVTGKDDAPATGQEPQTKDDAEEGSGFSMPDLSLPEFNVSDSKAWLTPVLLIALVLLVWFTRSILIDLGGRILALGTALFGGKRSTHRSGRRLLKGYRRILLRSYGVVKLFHRYQQPMDMVRDYQPLKLRGLPDAETMDVDDAVQHYKRLLILGAPGAGKSLVLQRLALRSADTRLVELPGESLPILLQLHRMNGAPMPLRKMLSNRLWNQKVRGADALVNRGLTEGNLMLLLDGLDEVSQYDRHHVLVDIKTLLARFPDVRCVITCRKSAYRNELQGVMDATAELVGFDDTQINQFLAHWANPQEQAEDGEVDPLATQSSAELALFLDQNTSIRNLARNPMMLTILAFIRTSTQTVNVQTRSRYIAEACDVLLTRDTGENRKFPAEQKQKLLCHLARMLQDHGAREGADMFSMPKQVAIDEVPSALPRLTKTSEAKAILDEIVEQSGLLWLINQGDTFKFAHPTVQQYFAAASLLTNQEGLVIRYRSDPDAWRESVKFWCGLVDNPDKVIETVMRLEPNTAVACRAEARSAADGLPPDMLDSLVS